MFPENLWQGPQLQVDAFQIKNYASRERLVGGFYGYSYLTETKKVAAEVTCTGSAGAVTNDKGSPPAMSVCRSPERWQFRSISTTLKGVDPMPSPRFHVRGSDNGNFPVENADRMDLIPTKKLYEPVKPRRCKCVCRSQRLQRW